MSVISLGSNDWKLSLTTHLLSWRTCKGYILIFASSKGELSGDVKYNVKQNLPFLSNVIIESDNEKYFQDGVPLVKWTETLLEIIAKYGWPVRQWPLLFQKRSLCKLELTLT